MGQDNYQIGQRIILDHLHRGTIRFTGTLTDEDQKIWLGIEWDQVDRGKHDGSFKGRCMFRTKWDYSLNLYQCTWLDWKCFFYRVPGSGSFVQASSNRISMGQTFLNALTSKYLIHDFNDQEEAETKGLTKVYKRFAQLDRIRLIGLESLEVNGDHDHQDLSDNLLPRSLPLFFCTPFRFFFYSSAKKKNDVDKWNVWRDWNPYELIVLIPELETLNLSSNLFSRLDQVAEIVEKIPSLKTLILKFSFGLSSSHYCFFFFASLCSQLKRHSNLLS